MATAEHTTIAISIRNVLIATDFSRQSSDILHAGMSFCQARSARALILYVLPNDQFALAGPEAYAAARDAVQRDLEALECEMRSEYGYERGKDYELLMGEGDVPESVLECAREKHIDLIAVGTHGRTGLSKALLGSVAESIFRHSEIPVLTVGPSARHLPSSGPRRVLVPIDFTAVSQHSASYACALARDYQAELVLIHVIGDVPTRGALADFDVLNHGVEQRLAEFVPCDAKPGHLKFIVECGSPVPTILKTAFELKPDLMVLGAHEYPHLRDQFRRKPAYELVCGAPCPVLTVR
jgi:nucleotide-binding universal stress UspA family protein